MRTLKVKVVSGLASRCCTLADAYYLAKKYGFKLKILWPNSDDCACDFYDIFSKDIFSDIEFSVKNELSLSRRFHKEGSVRSLIESKQYFKAFSNGVLQAVIYLCFFYIQIKRFVQEKNWVDYIPASWEKEVYTSHSINSWNELRTRLDETNKTIYVRAYCGLIIDESYHQNLSCIKFKEDYWNEVNNILKRKNLEESFANLVSIHIRRTDHKVAIANSATEKFVERMKSILEATPNTYFFVASDDNDEVERMKSIFGDRIITQSQKVWGRDSLQAMKSAVVDLLCLGSGEYLLGSSTSVFSSFSARYQNKELIVINNE